MGFKVAKSLKFDSLKKQGLKLILRYGFVIWLWAFLFARVPLAAFQDLFGLQSRPLLLLDCLSVGFAFVAFSQVGWRPWKVFQTSIVRVAYLSFALFWAFYSLRLVFDHWILSVDLVTPASTLFKHLLTSTLIPALCLPWILTLASWGSTLPVLVGLGSISLFFGELSFVFITGFDALMKARFAFEDLNPIPAAHSSASLVILSSLFLWCLFCQNSRATSGYHVWLGLIGALVGLLGMQLAMTKAAFLALIPLVLYLACCLWHRFRLFGFATVLAMSMSAVVLMFGMMHRTLSTSIVDRIELLRMSLGIWFDNWLLGIGFRSQGLLFYSPLTKDHWYPHNFLAESLLLGGVVLAIFLCSFIVSTVITASFDIEAKSVEDTLQVPLTFLWIQGLASALFSGHLALIPGLWVGGLVVVLNRYR